MNTISLSKPFGKFSRPRPNQPAIPMSMVHVKQELQSSMYIAKVLGLTGMVMVEQAAGAVLKSTGVDLKVMFATPDLSGVAPKLCYGATELAALIGGIGVTSRSINKALIKAGMQTEVKTLPGRCRSSSVLGYNLTDKGSEHAVVGKNGRLRVRSFKWKESVIPLLKAFL